MKLAFAPAGSRDAATAIRLAVRAEELGYDEVWVSEDYLERGAFAVAAGIAARTTRVRIGLGVINPWTRHVALAAMECAALDEISQGRLVVGLGASNARWMEGLLGIPFSQPIQRLTEYATALRVLLSGQQLDAEVGGRPVHAALSFRPIRADVPIQLGVKGPIALERGAAVADGFMLSVLSSPAYVEWVARAHPGLPLTAYVMTSLSRDPAGRRAAVDRLRPRVAQFLGVHGPSRIATLGGVEEHLAVELRRRLVSGQPATDLVDGTLVSRLTLTGTATDAADSAAAFAEAGLDVLVLMDDGVADVPERMFP